MQRQNTHSMGNCHGARTLNAVSSNTDHKAVRVLLHSCQEQMCNCGRKAQDVTGAEELLCSYTLRLQVYNSA
jgi:hypothetical protein